MVTGVKLLMNLKMKKIYSYMVAAVATVAAISCTQELDNQRVTDTSVFTAFADGADTKTVKEGKQSLWSEGDQIWVLNGQKGDDNDYSWKKSYTTSSDATNEAVFNEDQEYEMTGNAFFAVYPASAADKATWAGQGNEVKHVELKKVQTATPDSFDPEAHIAVAQTTDNTLSFKNAVSLLKFQVASPGVKSVTFYSNNKEKRELLTGLCSISADGNVTAWTNKIDESTQEAENWVELSADHGEFQTGTDYYFSVFPVTLAKGFTVEFSYDGDNKQTIKSYNSELTLSRNGVLDLGVIEHDAHPFSIAGTFNNWNTLANPMVYENALYVAKGVTDLSSSSTGFKFVVNGEIWRGAKGEVAAGTWDYVWGDNGQNIYVNGATPETAYDIYLTLSEGDYGMFVVVPAGEPMPKMSRGLAFASESVSAVIGNDVAEPKLDGKTEGVVYTSSDPEVATVDASGNVTAVGAGTTTITASAPATDVYLAGSASYELVVDTVVKYCDVYVCISDLKWNAVYLTLGSGTCEQLTENVEINNKKYYKKSLVANQTYSFTFRNGSKASSNFFKVEIPNVSLNEDVYYRLSARGAIEVDPNDVKTFGYAIYVFDQKSKNAAPNLYAWNDNNAWKNQYGGNFGSWPGVAFKEDCYYQPADGQNWKHYYYYEIPPALYGKSFKFIVNKTGQTEDISITSLSSDLYVGYWYDSTSSNGFWVNPDKTTPITQ